MKVTIEFKDINVDIEARTVKQDNEVVNLTTKEYELLV